VARLALKRLRLDQVWLLVSPGNPLKPTAGMAPMADRLRSAAGIADGRRILATGIEARLHTLYTYDTLRALRRLFPYVQFVWLMGADNLVQLPRWQHWIGITRLMPFAVVPRPTYNAPAPGAASRADGAGARERARPRLDVPAGTAEPALGNRVAAGSDDACTQAGARRTKRAPAGRSTVIARKPADPAAKPAARRPPKPAAALAEAAKIPGTPRKKAAAAGPRAVKAKPAAPAAKDRLDAVQAVIVESLEADKAEEVVALDLAGRASFADRMVIATGLADRQITAMATHLEEKLAEVGIKRVQIEGGGGSDWVLIDAGDIVIHLFKPEARALYALEKMWGAELDEPGETSTA